ncbi:adenylate kinase [Candidatus Palibaumannia cicadellinicola]|uniref:Adenylate kinase n=1 Tax=Baumannia cicadellinicola subsp. Homalodisca coagulata TaxID=374463 RepID=KAD_BAUCH|nr:adenylate kinase [Candidatus Baumannia cicadellinicola]Q1LTX5.1 RecName: Full=Adenylate kinase; Short=AK; AltName: Full=ATP-AMP transphosphorylase; AltName: Full=ATP:AMP phosphotransferase; AltName: Full=Adenylate monophosphate kinase [Baumannia cicadellinicola str. Hc (Homalodisca coagulata)]ABF14062.1 adenylate kinase [Baumannia cicadellinicola str. Hc (Homalodisca coagulata)]MBS0032643.1 adenylate kinase [Candidatus Baumannia cicadellinicola]MCJ7462429.1 adenylate kinase [Candidatus Bauma
MRIILLGAPGSGKGTQAQFIMKKYGIPHISTGDMLRTTVNKESVLGKNIQAIIKLGNLVPDQLVIELVKERIIQYDCSKGFLLDGFPRTLTQAYAMEVAGINVDIVLILRIPDKIIINRIVGRMVHEPSGRIYHVTFNPPKQKGKDDITGENLIIRQDDKEDTVRHRLIGYHQQMIPIITYYNNANIRNIRCFTIDANCPISTLNEKIVRILG